MLSSIIRITYFDLRMCDPIILSQLSTTRVWMFSEQSVLKVSEKNICYKSVKLVTFARLIKEAVYLSDQPVLLKSIIPV